MPLPLEVLGLALLNSLWQGGILAVAAGVCLRVLPPVRAETRYAIWFSTLIAIMLVPAASTLISVSRETPSADGTVMTVAPGVPAIPEFVGVAQSDKKPFLPIAIPNGLLPWLLGIWAVGCVALIVRLIHGCQGLRRLKADSEAPGGLAEQWEARWRHSVKPGRVPGLRVSASVRVPLTAGLFHPVVLFPRALLDSLSEEETYSIWLHETAHVRRRDDWTKLLQRLAEALLFFHPALTWVGRRLNLERELACDDWVVAKTGRPKSYAACLCRLAELAAPRPYPTPALGVADDRKQIYRRVEMLVKKDHTTPRKQPWYAAAAMVVLLAGTLLALTFTSPVFAVAQPAPPNPVQPTPVMVAQEAPPPPPVPAPRSAAAPVPIPPPAPAPKAVPSPPPAAQSSVEQLRREMQGLAEEMRRFQEEMRPALEEMRVMSERLREQVEREIRPRAEELRGLQEKLQQQAEEMRPTQEQIRRLRDSIVEIEQERARAMEDQARAQEDKLRAFSEAMRGYQEAMRTKELEYRELVEKQKALASESAPPPDTQER